MAIPNDGINPLRPYYTPPSIGTAPEALSSNGGRIPNSSNSAPSSFSFIDFDYSDYLPGANPPSSASVRQLLEKTIWKYVSVLMAQPFEVAKLILQVHLAQDHTISSEKVEKRSRYGDDDDDAYLGVEDSSDDELNLFTSSAPSPGSDSTSPPRGRPWRPPKERRKYEGPSSSKQDAISGRYLSVKNPHSLKDALSSLVSGSGLLAPWRATNTTFIYTILHRTLEAFLGAFVAAVFGIPEAEVLRPSLANTLPSTAILASSAPLASIAITAFSSTLSSIILGPIDAARTRLILTPSSFAPRSLLPAIKTLPSPAYLIPPHLLSITALTSIIPALTSSATPLFLKNYLNIDPVLHSASWSIATFTISAFELVIRYPLETVLRRAQIATWTVPPAETGIPPTQSSSHKATETIVPVPQSYLGILPTMWSIVKEEGYKTPSASKQKGQSSSSIGRGREIEIRKPRKGQGIEGLYRGWRVGMWGLFGMWGASLVGGNVSSSVGAGQNLSFSGMVPTQNRKF